MKKRIMIILIGLHVSFLSTQSFADYCPFSNQISPRIPPGGWSLLMPLLFPGDNYRFVSAIHSLNTNYFYQQVICNYECVPNQNSLGCSPLMLISNAQYLQPRNTAAPWNVQPNLVNTVVCMSRNNNPLECVFNN